MDPHRMLVSSLISCLLLFSLPALAKLIMKLQRQLLLIMRPWQGCKCDVCQAYLTRSWTSTFDHLSDWYTHLLRHSPTATIHIHVMRNTITANPLNVEHILRTNFDNYPKGTPFSAILGDFLGRGIFVADGDNWRFQRKIASLELGSVSVRSFAHEILFSEINTRLIPFLSSSVPDDHHRTFDLQDVFRRFSFDNICRFSFGIDPGCLQLTVPMSELAEAFDIASKLSAERALVASPWIWKLKRALNLGSEKRLRDAIRKINILADDIIQQRKRIGFSGKRDLLSRFMSTTTNNVNDDVDSKQYLRDIVISFLLAGRDTVASALTFFFYLISKNPDVESRIRQEGDRVLGQLQQLIPLDKLREMYYLHAALYESLRLFPPVMNDSKFSKDDDVLPDGAPVKKGDKVSYNPYAMGRMEGIWGSDCLEFKPERWLRDGVFCPESLYRYPVFQAGPRVCLGKELAIVAMKTVAISLIRRFDVRLVEPGQAPRFVPGLTATLSGGLPVVVRAKGGGSHTYTNY